MKTTTTEREPLPRGFWVIWSTVALDMVGFGIVAPILGRYADRFGASGLQVGLLFASFSQSLIVTAVNLNAEWKVMGEVRVPACGFIQRDERTVDLIVSRDVAMAANEFLSRGIGTALLRMTSRGITLTQDVYSISLESTYYPAVYRTQCDPYVKCWNGAWTTSVCPPQPRNGGRGSH